MGVKEMSCKNKDW